MNPTTEDIRDRLAPLRDLEPSHDQIDRALRATPPAAPRRRRAPRRAALALAAAAAVSGAAAALPGGPDPTGADALRAAAAAAADQPGPADFEGYRYVLMRDRQVGTWGLPDEGCLKENPIPPAREDGKPSGRTCPLEKHVQFVEEGRQELWVDAHQGGTRRDHGSRIVEISGDADLAQAVRKEFRREAETVPYEYGDGAFGKVPLAELSTDADALLAQLREAYADGRWSTNPRAFAGSRMPQSSRDYELAIFTVLLAAEANATPRLRAAAFEALALMPGLRALGPTTDPEGREGQGVELAFPPDPRGFRGEATVRVVFDEDRGDILTWSRHEVRDGKRTGIEHVLLESGHVDDAPAPTRR